MWTATTVRLTRYMSVVFSGNK